ncbi:MAG TPA: ATP-binding protein [Clostridiales bacterium]|nr:ATP-binding protein [Clostridiales bacterium]
MLDKSELRLKLVTLAVFRRILRDPVINALLELLAAGRDEPDKAAAALAEYVHLLMEAGGDLGAHIGRLVLADENAYLRARIKGGSVPAELEQLAHRELLALEEVAAARLDELAAALGVNISFPALPSSHEGLARRYFEAMDALHTRGYGMFAEHAMFTFDRDGLRPVSVPDPVRLSELFGYDRERGEVLANILAFLEGKPAANMLLYGDSGTGKSSTVKAIVNEYAPHGLRLVELRQNALGNLDNLVETLAENPLKFIVYIDDLSLESNDPSFGPLKAALEGSACVRADNIVFCATSNRRRIVRQTFSEREGDDINHAETIEEKTSLSDRFGLAVGFFRPDKIGYAEIVRGLAGSRGIEFTPELEAAAEQFALRHGGRSGRTAKQFIDLVSAG